MHMFGIFRLLILMGFFFTCAVTVPIIYSKHTVYIYLKQLMCIEKVCQLTRLFAHCCPKQDISTVFPDPACPTRAVTFPEHPWRKVSSVTFDSKDPNSASHSKFGKKKKKSSVHHILQLHFAFTYFFCIE